MRADGLERRACDGLARQRVLDDTHIHALGPRLGTQIGHLRHREAAILGGDHGKGLAGHLRNLRDERFLAFKVECHSCYLLA